MSIYLIFYSYTTGISFFAVCHHRRQRLNPGRQRQNNRRQRISRPAKFLRQPTTAQDLLCRLPPQSGRQSSLPSAFLRSSRQSARDGSRQALPPLGVNGGFAVCLPLILCRLPPPYSLPSAPPYSFPCASSSSPLHSLPSASSSPLLCALFFVVFPPWRQTAKSLYRHPRMHSWVPCGTFAICQLMAQVFAISWQTAKSPYSTCFFVLYYFTAHTHTYIYIYI